MLDRMNEQLAEANEYLYNEQTKRVRKGGYIRRMENKLRPFSFDAGLYVIVNRDVFKTAVEQKQALRTMREAIAWANKDYKKDMDCLSTLKQEYRILCNNISIIQDNIKTLEQGITELKWCIKEYDNNNTSQL